MNIFLKEDPIVVTGMGVVSPLGVGVDVNWQRLIKGQSGIVFNDRFDVTDFACKIAGLLPRKSEDTNGFDVKDFVGHKDIKKMDLFIQYSLAASQEAIEQANWHPSTTQEQEMTATIIATGVGGFPAMTKSTLTVAQKGASRLSPFTVPAFLANLAAGHVSIKYGFKGPIGAPVTACAASAQALGDGMRLILSGEASVAVCGGAEACVDPVAIGGFTAAKALAVSFNDSPEKASRPFDSEHAGFVLSEGAATLVIERLSHAIARGATPLATILGYGTSADAHHLTASPADGAGGQHAMRRALKMSGLVAEDIDYINAHSTSTPVGDAAEIAGITALFAQQGKSLSITSTKSATGHLLGAAGALEAIFSIKSLQNNLIPPALNLITPMDAANIFDMVGVSAQSKNLDYVMSNGFGFGGVNASLVFGNPPSQ